MKKMLNLPVLIACIVCSSPVYALPATVESLSTPLAATTTIMPCEWERTVANATLASLTVFANMVTPITNHIHHLERALQALKTTNQDLSATNQALNATNRDLSATNQALNATNQALDAENYQLKQTKPPRCGHVTGYTYYEETGSCYRLSSDQMTWPQASAKCHEEGAYLAIINSEAERLVLKSMQQKLNLGWSFIGFFREVSDATSWRTIDGETLKKTGYTTWRNGFPNIELTDNIYGGIDYDGLLISEPNYAKDYIICEKKPVY